MFSFSGFTLDPERGELRDPSGELARLRPRAFELLRFFVANPRRLLSKRELMEAVWPGIHVGEDSLFQAIRDIRIALRDDDKQIIRLMFGRGYQFAADVSSIQTPVPGEHVRATASVPIPRGSRARMGLLVAWLALLLVAAIGLAFVMRGSLAYSLPPSVGVRPIAHVAEDRQGTSLSQGILTELVAGLSKIDGVDLIEQEGRSVSDKRQNATYEVQGELRREGPSWHYQARLVDLATGRIETVAEISADPAGSDIQKLQSRFAARVGYAFAERLNGLQAIRQPRRDVTGDVAIRQAIASINQTTRERFSTARNILETNLAADPDNVDLQVALAALHLRGIQMTWYDQGETQAAEENARVLLEKALKGRPNNMAVLGAYCRFLTVTNQFSESLVACAKVLTVNPWDGMALFHLGMTQIQLARFDDALAAFSEADRFDTPEVSRWTWMLGAGWANLLVGRNEAAVGWLERSVAITPASGRAHLLLAAAYQRLGRSEEARNAFTKAMEIRPDSTARNISLPARNASDVYLRARQDINRILVQLGLPN
ncbi:tetratricopeptide repeat protein [Mesorhizobium amorphae]